MENQNLNVTETCFACKKSAARWLLAADSRTHYYTELGNLVLPPGIFFCPVCDRVTPEDLEENDTRTIVVPRAKEAEPAIFNGAEEYRILMGPQRPFRAAGSKTMRRRYGAEGEEVRDEG